MMLFAVLIAPKASALSPDYRMHPNTIYYFTDFYPSVSKGMLHDEFIGYDVVLDRQIASEQNFNYLVDSGYFDGFLPGTVVIIDIKSFLPDNSVLTDLFFNLKAEQECITAFITVYDEGEFEGFSGLVDAFIDNADYEILEKFIAESFYDYGNSNNGVANTSYLIDDMIVGVEINELVDQDLSTLCSSSPFIRAFVIGLANSLGAGPYYYNDNIDFNDEIVPILEDNNIKIFVQVGSFQFVDIVSWGTPYNCDRLHVLTHDDSLSTDRFVCAFGFSLLHPSFYSFLSNMELWEHVMIPKYILLVEEMTYSENGLSFTTSDFLEVPPIDSAGRELLDALHALLDT